MAKWRKKRHLVGTTDYVGPHPLPGDPILEGDYWADFQDVLEPVHDDPPAGEAKAPTSSPDKGTVVTVDLSSEEKKGKKGKQADK